MTAEGVGCALKLSNNGKAPGIDGIPYEFYRILDIIFRRSKDTDRESFDVLGFLTNSVRFSRIDLTPFPFPFLLFFR